MDRLPLPKPYRDSPDVTHVDLPDGSYLGLAGRRCRARFGFYRGAFFRVSFISEFQGDVRSTATDRLAWRSKVVALIQEKYGNPRVDEQRPGEWVAEWSVNGLTDVYVVAFEDVLEGKKGVDVALGYADPVRMKLANGIDPADKNKL